MSSVLNHRKRAHRSERKHVESVRQMMQFSSRVGVILPWGMGGGSVFGRNFLGQRRKREKQET